MSPRSLRRPLALTALALVLLAALPCSTLASEDACCGAAAPCGEASESPCAQLAATPCCDSGGATEGASVAPQVHIQLALAACVPLASESLPVLTSRTRVALAPLRDSISLRTIVLRL